MSKAEQHLHGADSFVEAVEEGLADLRAGRGFTHDHVRLAMRERFGRRTEGERAELDSTLMLDAGVGRRYDLEVSKVRAAEQPRLTSDEAERERIVAKIERSLAKLDAGQGVPHGEVLAMIDARYPGSKK